MIKSTCPAYLLAYFMPKMGIDRRPEGSCLDIDAQEDSPYPAIQHPHYLLLFRREGSGHLSCLRERSGATSCPPADHGKSSWRALMTVVVSMRNTRLQYQRSINQPSLHKRSGTTNCPPGDPGENSRVIMILCRQCEIHIRQLIIRN